MVKILSETTNEPETPETKEPIIDKGVQPAVLKQGVQFKLLDAMVMVKHIDLPRLTLQLVNKKQAFNPKYRGHILEFGGHDFLVKAVSGSRLYLILVDVKTKESADE